VISKKMEASRATFDRSMRNSIAVLAEQVEAVLASHWQSMMIVGRAVRRFSSGWRG